MKYYAYKGRATFGKEPVGSGGKLLFQLKTDAGAVRRAIKYLGRECSVFKYTNFYYNGTFKQIY